MIFHPPMVNLPGLFPSFAPAHFGGSQAATKRDQPVAVQQ